MLKMLKILKILKSPLICKKSETNLCLVGENS